MTSGEIKQFIVDNLFNGYSNQLSNKKKWLRETKIKFSSYAEFDEKYENLSIEDIIEDAFPVVQYGSPPANDTPHVFRRFMNYGSDEGDFELYVFTDATDSKIVYAAGSSD